MRYAGAGAFTALVVAGRLALDPWWGREHNRHLVFLPTVMLAAWLGGFGAGVLSAVITTLALAYFWTEPIHTPQLSFDLVLFFAVSLVICALVRSLHAARARAEAAQRAREQVMAVVVHDLRNPLTALKMTSEALQRKELDPESGRRFKILDHALARMEDLIRDLFEAARMEKGDLPVSLRPENVLAIVEEAVELHAPLARERGTILEAKVPDRQAYVSCDRHRLLQVLGNLMGNALRYTPAGGRITLRADSRERSVRFAVEDTGTGIKPEHLPHVFEQYWNADSKGTGLGLYIARNIVEAHGGEIGVRSEPGAGACFFFTVPRPQ